MLVCNVFSSSGMVKTLMVVVNVLRVNLQMTPQHRDVYKLHYYSLLGQVLTCTLFYWNWLAGWCCVYVYVRMFCLDRRLDTLCIQNDTSRTLPATPVSRALNTVMECV